MMQRRLLQMLGFMRKKPASSITVDRDTSANSITVDRDSVCAGDDCVSHEATFSVASSCNVLEVLAAAWQACPLARISGDKATWLIDVGDAGNCIGVMAEQWDQPKLLIETSTSAAELFNGTKRALYFRYWCQSNPDAVLEAVKFNTPLPDRYSG
jgi:hypothetical protein